ncbi:UNVERIFIED_CONTAM: hypothetical protein GTU68_016660 [Idotea baltica]|nr:hypothetical protein [Idotea baltica]
MAKKRKALGRGLDSILPTNIPGVFMIPLDQIEVNPFQPRKHFQPEPLKELAESIRVHGIIQPLTVRKLSDNQYQLIAGERRMRASQIAELTEVPAYIRTANDEEMLEMALIENIQREDLNPVEIANSYQLMIDELGLKQEDLGAKVGKDRSTVTNYLSLLKLPPEVKAGLRDKLISMGHAKAIKGVQDTMDQMRLFEQVVEQGMSVRQTEKVARDLRTPKKAVAKKTAAANPQEIHLRKLISQMEEKFGNKVKIQQKQADSEGAITVHFNNDEDLNRLLEILDIV